MPFQKGNKLAKGGYHPRKPENDFPKIQKLAREVFQQTIEEDCQRLARHYLRRAYKSDRVLVNAADKIWPDSDTAGNSRPVAIQIIVNASPESSTDITTTAENVDSPSEGNSRPILIGGS